MSRKTLVSVLLLVNVVLLSAQDTFDLPIQIPSIGGIVTRITNTTFGIVKGGINLVSRTVDRVISRFSRVEDRLRELLEEFRKFIVKGIPEFNIPVLDPLHVEKINFNIIHEAVALKGNVEDVTVKHISKFIIDKQKFAVLNNFEFKLDLNLTFPFLTIDGLYDLNGIIGDAFTVFGKGKFWLRLSDFKVATSVVVKFRYPELGLRVTTLNIDLKLKKLENNFENFMNDEELSDLFNRAISKMAPEALDLLWPDIKEPIEKQILQYINHILENATVASLARRLFNIT